MTLTQLWTQNELCLFGLLRYSCNLCINVVFFFSFFREAHLTFLNGYKLINGILSSVHKLTASMNTVIDETIRVDQI